MGEYSIDVSPIKHYQGNTPKETFSMTKGSAYFPGSSLYTLWNFDYKTNSTSKIYTTGSGYNSFFSIAIHGDVMSHAKSIKVDLY